MVLIVVWVVDLDLLRDELTLREREREREREWAERRVWVTRTVLLESSLGELSHPR